MAATGEGSNRDRIIMSPFPPAPNVPPRLIKAFFVENETVCAFPRGPWRCAFPRPRGSASSLRLLRDGFRKVVSGAALYLPCNQGATARPRHIHRAPLPAPGGPPAGPSARPPSNITGASGRAAFAGEESRALGARDVSRSYVLLLSFLPCFSKFSSFFFFFFKHSSLGSLHTVVREETGFVNVWSVRAV